MAKSKVEGLENRSIKLKGPRPEKEINLMRAQVVEELGSITEISAEFLSTNLQIDLDDLVGKKFKIEIEDSENHFRYYHGTCIEARYLGLKGSMGHYRIEVRPWLWFLTRRHDLRIFQDMTVKDILGDVFKKAGFSDYKIKVTGALHKRDYCVQYRESDFDFISRLMQEEGIYYYFSYDDKRETLQIADDTGAHKTVPQAATIDYYPREPNFPREENHIYEWRDYENVQTGIASLTDYDFERTTADLSVKKSIKHGSHGHNTYESYDYPGHHLTTSVGEKFARVRMEEFAGHAHRARGLCNVRTMAVGYRFGLKKHPRSGANADWMLVKCIHKFHVDVDYKSTGNEPKPLLKDVLDIGEGEEDEKPQAYRCEFTVQEAKTPFRSPRTTPWPRIDGVHTAVVVGKKGEEIWTDKYGRIRVQFHWDRFGKKDENSTCWIRYASPWVGKKWGAVAIPRIGQEVVVQFEEGNPDRPIGTGMLYNATNMPPYELPANQTQSGIKTNSSKGGGGFNELMMEDKKDSELVRFQSEKDYEQIVKNNATITIGLEKKDKGDLTQTIHRNKTETLNTGDHTFTVKDGNETRKIKKDHSETIEGKSTVTITGDRTETIKQGNMTVSVNQGNMTETVKLGNFTQKINAGKSLQQAMQSIELKCGGSSIKLTPTSIEIKSMQVKINGSMMFEAKGGISAKVQGGATAEVKGALVLIN